MGWARFDDKYTLNPKILAAGPSAEFLDMRAIIWCAGHETDGLIAEEALSIIGRGIPKLRHQIGRLIEVGRWEAVDGGWMVLHYLDYNPSKAQCDKRRAEGKERAARSRERNAKQTSAFAVGSGDPRAGDGTGISLEADARENCSLCDSKGLRMNERNEAEFCDHEPQSAGLKLLAPLDAAGDR